MNKESRLEALVSEVAELQDKLLTSLHITFPAIAHTPPTGWPRRVELHVDGVTWRGSVHGMGYRFESEDGLVIEAHDRIQTAPPYPIDDFRIAAYAQSRGIQSIGFMDLPGIAPEPEEVFPLLQLMERAGLLKRDKRVEAFRSPRYLVTSEASWHCRLPRRGHPYSDE